MKNNNFPSNNYAHKPLGFTLIEIIITISVIGILTTIVGLSLHGAQAKSRDSQRYSKANVISEYLEKYYQSNGSYPSCDELTKDPATVTNTILKGLSADTLAAPGVSSGTNSISCSTTAINVYYYNSNTTDDGRGIDGRQYVLKYVEEATGDTETIKSRYGIALLDSSTIHANATSDSQIALDWTAVDKAAEYKVQRATDDRFKNDLFEETLTGLSSVHSGLATGTKYYFRVVGQAMNASSDWSQIAEEVTIVLPPTSAAPIVAVSTPALVSTWSWNNATCAAGTVAEYRYTYTNNGGYNSGLEVPTDKHATSIPFTTAPEGYTYTVAIQALCSTAMASSTLSPAGSASYTRPITSPLAPTIAAAFSSPNVVATITPTTCGTGMTAQYAIRSRTNDGAWGSYSAWSDTILTASQAAVTGVKYGYQAQIRCHNVASDSNVSSSVEAVYSHPIAAPTAPTVTANTAGSSTTWSWSAPTCAAGSANYQYLYTNDGGFNSGWTASAPTSVAFTTSNQGYTFTVQVQSRCSTTSVNSAWSSSGSASYRRPYTYTITTAAGSGGSVSAGGSYLENTSVTITATPNTGYSFSSWSGAGCGGTASHNVTLTSNMSCTANFTINYYTVSVASGGDGTVSGGGSIAYGSSTTITASANTGYSFSSWSGTGCNGVASHSVTVTAAMSCTANFTINSYTLTLTPGTGGTVSGGGTYAYGSVRTITATPNSGYLFNSWTGSAGCAGVASHSITVTTTLSCTANFIVNNFTITLLTSGRGNYTFCANENGTCSFTGTSTVRYGAYSSWSYKYNVVGSTACTNANFGDPLPDYVKTCQYQASVSASGGGTFAGGSSNTITASPSGSFDSWTGGTGCSGTYSHSFTLSANTTCTANFSNHLVDSPTPPPAPSAPTLSASFVSNNAVLTVNAVSCSVGSAQYQIRYLRQKYTSDSSWTSWTAWSTTRSMTQTAQQGNKHNFEVIARCNNGGTYSLNSTTASTNIIMDISTPAAPTYAGPASFSHNVYQVVNFTNYCPSNTDLVNGTFVSNLSSTANIWGPHPFGYNDYWTNLEGRTLNATYWGTYQCQTSFKASAVSPQGVRVVPVYSG